MMTIFLLHETMTQKGLDTDELTKRIGIKKANVSRMKSG